MNPALTAAAAMAAAPLSPEERSRLPSDVKALMERAFGRPLKPLGARKTSAGRKRLKRNKLQKQSRARNR